jgi:hypothetical protein
MRGGRKKQVGLVADHHLGGAPQAWGRTWSETASPTWNTWFGATALLRGAPYVSGS